MIPKILWAYWDGPETELLNISEKSWNTFALPEFKIYKLNRNNLYNWLNKNDLPINFDNLGLVQRQSDIIRLAILNKYGGVYIDFSTILQRNLDKWLSMVTNNKSNFVAFTTDSDNKNVIENWFLATSKNNPIILEWYIQFKNDLENYILFNNNLKKNIINLNETKAAIYVNNHTNYKWHNTEYFHMHRIMIYLRETNPNIKKLLENNNEVSLIDSATGPFFLQKPFWSKNETLTSYKFTHIKKYILIEYEAKIKETIPFVKLTSGCRDVLKNIDFNSLPKDSALLFVIQRTGYKFPKKSNKMLYFIFIIILIL